MRERPTNRSDERACNRANLLVQMSISRFPSFLTHAHTQQQHQKFNRINMYCVDFILDVFFSTHSFFPSHLICVHSFICLFLSVETSSFYFLFYNPLATIRYANDILHGRNFLKKTFSGPRSLTERETLANGFLLAANERNNIRKIHTKTVQIITRPNRTNERTNKQASERMDGRTTRELPFTVRVHQSGNVHIRCGINLDAYIVDIKLSSLMKRAKSGASNTRVCEAAKRHPYPISPCKCPCFSHSFSILFLSHSLIRALWFFHLFLHLFLLLAFFIPFDAHIHYASILSTISKLMSNTNWCEKRENGQK